MKFFRAVILAAVLSLQISHALAGINNPGSGSSSPGPNSALSGIVGFDEQMFPFVNFMRMANSFPTFSGTTFIYPNNLLQGSNLPNGSISTRMGFSVALPSNVYSGHYVFSMQGTVGGNGVQFATNGSTNQPGNVYSKSAGTTITGCSNLNVPPCTYTSLNITGTNPQIEFDNSPVVASLLINWAATSTWSGMTSAVLCKLADFNVDSTCNTDSAHAWTGGFNNDFVAKVAALRPHHIRFLDVNDTVFQPASDYTNWQTTSAWSYNLQDDFWTINNWFGSDSGTNSYSISCANGTACTYALTGSAPVDGDYIQFYNTNANTSASPTITITDKNSVTSSAIPLFNQDGTHAFVTIGGTPTQNDTISLTFNTTPVSAGTCLSGGTHTTSAYTVGASDSVGNIANQLYSIVNADATLSAQNSNITARNPFGGSGFFFTYWARNACTVTISANITGAATETATIGPMRIGALTADTLYSATYSALLKAFVVQNQNTNGGGQDNSWPWIVQMQLAQAVSTKSGVQVGCWLETPIGWSTTSFTSLVNLASANQCPGGTYFELSNEIWNTAFFSTINAIALGNSIGLGLDQMAYYELRQRQLWAIASSTFGGIAGNLHTVSTFQTYSNPSSEYNGTTLCGTSCGNQSYQNAIGVDYNSAPNRPVDFTRHFSEAPYYDGAILTGGSYQSSGSYGSWSATSSSVSANVLTVAGTVTGTIWWNQGISSCDGTYIAAPTPSNPTTAQLSGTVTTTLNGAVTDNTHTWTLTSTAGLSAGMWIFDQTTGMINGIIGSVNSGAHQITNTGKAYRSAGANDTLIFGGLAGTYQLNSTTCSAASGTITGGDVLGLQYAADNFNSVNTPLGSVQDAYNWIYQDVLVEAKNNNMDQGTSLASANNAFNILGGAAVTAGVSVQDYEGGYDGIPPTTAQATSMGLTSAYGYTNGATFGDGYIGLMLTGFKNSATFKSLVTAAHNNELALLPLNSMSQWYTFTTNARWALFPAAGLYATPFQSYNAICAYNGNPC